MSGAHEDTPPIAVPIQMVTGKPHRLQAVKGKPRPPVVIVLEDGSKREPAAGEIEFEELGDG